MDKIVVALPAYNEGASLPQLFAKLEELRAVLGDTLHIVVVNDGSTDQTEGVLQQYAEKWPNFTYINHPGNRGLGEAMKTIFAYACERYTSTDVLVTMDADNTHNPRIIPELVNKLNTEQLDMTIASRFAAGGQEMGLSWNRKLYSRGARLFFKFFFPILNVNDYSSGFRAYRIGYLKRALIMYRGALITTRGFDCMAEIVARFSLIGVRAGEIPLVLEYHLKAGKSKMNVKRTIMGYFNLLRRVKPPRPAEIKELEEQL